jgi:hypothetical protein
MMRVTTIAALLTVLVAAPVGADRGFRGHGGGGHFRGGHFHGGGFRGPSIFIGGGIGWDPFWPNYYAYPYYPYAYPYPVPVPEPYPYPVSPPPQADDRRYTRDDDYEPPRNDAPEEDARRATYGLLEIRGVPNGADVDLDDRFWLKAESLDNRWLAVPEGQHTITVRVEGNEPASRDIEMRAGAKQVINFGPFRKR